MTMQYYMRAWSGTNFVNWVVNDKPDLTAEYYPGGSDGLSNITINKVVESKTINKIKNLSGIDGNVFHLNSYDWLKPSRTFSDTDSATTPIPVPAENIGLSVVRGTADGYTPRSASSMFWDEGSNTFKFCFTDNELSTFVSTKPIQTSYHNIVEGDEDGYLAITNNNKLPATAGIIRVPNNEIITARNQANNANIDLISADTSNRVKIGGVSNTVYIPGNLTVDGTLSASLTGSAGGDLSGTYPNPTVIDLTIFGEQQGSVLYRNATNWVHLAPGADGYALTTHNTGKNPTWSQQRLPIPEDYLNGVAAATVDAAGTWDIYINLMLSNKSECSLTPGRTYVISNFINFVSNNSLHGNNATIIPHSSFLGNNFLWIGIMTNVSITDLTLNGNYHFGGTPGAIFGIYVDRSSNVNLERLTIKNILASTAGATADIGIQGIGCKNIRVKDCNFSQDQPGDGQGHTAIGTFSSGATPLDPQNILITGCNINGRNYKTLISLDGAVLGVVVDSNFLYNSPIEGILIGYSAYSTEMKIIVSNNFIYNCGWSAIYLQSNSSFPVPFENFGVHILGNFISHCGGAWEFASIGNASIWLGHRDVTVTGNTILFSGLDADTGLRRNWHYSAIWAPTGVTAGVSGTISNNYVRDGYDSGILIDSANSIQVNNNKIIGHQYPLGLSLQFGQTNTHNFQVIGNHCEYTGAGTCSGISIAAYSPNSVISELQITNNTVKGNGASTYAGIALGLAANNLNTGSGIITNNNIINWVKGIDFNGSSVNLGTSFIIENNNIKNCTTGIYGFCESGTSWALLGPNKYFNCTTNIATIGDTVRLKETLILSPRRIILNDREPTTGEGTWQVGDEILMTESPGGIVKKICTIAGNPGTWTSIRSQLPIPEDYLNGQDASTIDAAGTWHIFINLMLAANSVCELSPNKTYNISSSIIINSNNKLFGKYSTVKIFSNFAGNVFSGTSKANVLIQDVLIDGNNLLSTGGATTGCGILFNSCSNSVIKNVNIKNLSPSTTTTAPTNCIAVVGTANNITIDNVTISQNSAVAGTKIYCINISATSINNIIIKNSNLFCANFEKAIVLDATTYSNNVSIVNNYIASGLSGINIGANSTGIDFNCLIKNNTIFNMSGFATYLAGITNTGCVLNENTISYCSGINNTESSSIRTDHIYTDVTNNNISYSSVDGYTLSNRSFTNAAIFGQTFGKISGKINDNTLYYNLYQDIYIDAADVIQINNNKITCLANNHVGGHYAIEVTLQTAQLSTHEIQINNNQINCVSTGLFSGIQTYSNGSRMSNLQIDGNQIYGDGYTSIRAGITFSDGSLSAAQITNNIVKYMINGLYTGYNNIQYLGYGINIEGNTFIDCFKGIDGYGDIGTSWGFIGANKYIGCTTPFTNNGPGADRLKECLQLSPRRVILNNVSPFIPAINEMSGVIGDEIIKLTSNSNGILKYICTAEGNPGTWSPISDGLKHVKHISSNTTLSFLDGYHYAAVNSSGGTLSVTLPASPADGDFIELKDTGSAATNNWTILGNGKNIDGGSSITVSQNYSDIILTYAAGTINQWLIG